MAAVGLARLEFHERCYKAAVAAPAEDARAVAAATEKRVAALRAAHAVKLAEFDEVEMRGRSDFCPDGAYGSPA